MNLAEFDTAIDCFKAIRTRFDNKLLNSQIEICLDNLRNQIKYIETEIFNLRLKKIK